MHWWHRYSPDTQRQQWFFSSLSLPRAMVGNFHLLNHLCSLKWHWDFQEGSKMVWDAASSVCHRWPASHSLHCLTARQCSVSWGLGAMCFRATQSWTAEAIMMLVKGSNPRDQWVQHFTATAEGSWTIFRKEMCGWSAPIAPRALKIISAIKV